MKFKGKWMGLVAAILTCAVIGNAVVTFVLYVIGKPWGTAWTGTVAQSTPGALNDLLLSIVVLILGIHVLRNI